MVLTTTTTFPLGYTAPDFNLMNPLTKNMESLNELKSEKATVVVFMCNHCPYVVHILDGLIQLANDYMPQGISIIGINSNDIIHYPDDSPENMVKLIEDYKIPFPYLFDETQEVARLFKAACTPDFSVFDMDMCCVYRGQFDDSRPGKSEPVTGSDIRTVLDTLLLNNKISTIQNPSMGCNIKWKQ